MIDFGSAWGREVDYFEDGIVFEICVGCDLADEINNEDGEIAKINLRGPLKTSVFRGFLTLWRKSPYVNSLYYKELRFSPRHL